MTHPPNESCWAKNPLFLCALLGAIPALGCNSGSVAGSADGSTDGSANLDGGELDGSEIPDDGAVVGNLPPTATFTASVSDLDVTVDASASSDADGSIVSYAWDFGDGSTDSGVMPAAHTYASSGTKTIMLTVTDDLGASVTSTQMVVVMEGVSNQSPVAMFTASASDLTVTVNGSGSSDADGSIVSYAWNFGDGASATGATPAAHTYASAGTKTITLTVTDNIGATGAVTKSVAVSEPPSPSVGPGAHLPIQYEIGSLTGTIWYVATNGNDSNAGTLASPYKTLAKAIGKVGSGQSATVVVRGGEYTDGSVSIPSGRKVHLVAYPGETPIFRGSAKFNSGWTTEGGLAWHAYTAKPVTDGSGISFTTGQNQTGSQMGKHPDQVWKGNSQLQQVGSKGEVSAGKFWVDAGNSRLYLASSDASSNSIEASDKVEFLSVSGSNSVIEGLRITRYSNSANNYGVVRTNVGADHVVFRDVEVIDPAFISIMAAGSAGDITDGVVFEHVTIDGPNWMGLNATWVDNLVVDSVRFVGANRFGEFTTSPQSGAIKTSRCRYIKVFDSEFTGNRSHGIWFDQSNVDVDVAGNVIDDNDGSALFFEISDDLLLINNFIRSSGGNRAVKLAGSSGLKLVNNTIIGGADPIGIYTDNRSKPGCADPNQALCSGSYSSDRRTAATRPATLDWMPRLDLMLNNIIVYPTATGYCGASTPFCVTSTNSTASAPIQTIIHGAEPGRGIPQTRMDGNVYANGAGSIVRVASGNYSSVSAWTTAAAGSPISIGGLDANSKAGNNLVSADGSATNALNHADAIALPTDADINQYLPAGTKHFGILP